MRHAVHTAWQRIGDEVVVIDLGSRRALGFNPAGSMIWELIGRTDEAALALLLAERFSVPLGTAEADVRAFLADLTARGLVEHRA